MKIFEIFTGGWPHQLIDTVVSIIQGTASLIFVLAFLLGPVWVVYRLFCRPTAREQIEEWCQGQRVHLVHMERRYLWAGPFFLSPNGTMVFYVTVRDESGLEGYYWMRCGYGLVGVWMHGLQVRCDKKKTKAAGGTMARLT